MFRERKLEHLGVTVRVCGYQPQGVPSIGDTPSPKNSISLDSHPTALYLGRLGPPGLLSKRPPKTIKQASKTNYLPGSNSSRRDFTSLTASR